jgi:glycosyltransferase involved in cell wall biosynthesis
MSQPPARVAIITRTLDRPQLLRRCLTSLLAQTCQDWHWYVVTPLPHESVTTLLAENATALAGRVTLLPFSAPVAGMRGLPLNHGIQNSTSELITILDDDDTWSPRFLEALLAVLDRSPGNQAAGAVCQTEVIEESSVSEGLTPLRNYTLNPQLRSLTLAQLAIVNQFCIHAFVYRRSALETVGLYPEDFPVLEDWHFNLRFLQQHDVVVLPEALTFYHQRPNVKTTSEANSLFGEVDAHKFYESKLINHHLRADLAAGRSGLGALLAAAAQNRLLQDRLHTLEGKIRTISEKTGKIDARTKEMKSSLSTKR